MKDSFDKCRYCMAYDKFEGCRSLFTDSNKTCFKANNEKIIETAKRLSMSVADVVALISIN